MSPARLNKVHNFTPKERAEAFLEKHALLFLFLCVFILFVLVTVLIYTLFGVNAAHVTGTEANVYYNGMEAII